MWVVCGTAKIQMAAANNGKLTKLPRNIRVASDQTDLSELTEEEECLFTAIGFGKVHKVPALLPQARSLEVRGHHSCTPLLYASRYAQGEYATFFVKLFVRHGCDVNAQDDAGATSLMHLIARQVSEDAMRPLLRCSRFEPNVQDKEGNTALMYAAVLGKTDLLEHLLSLILARGADDVSVRNREGLTALDLAVQAEQAECCRVLVTQGGMDVESVKDKKLFQSLCPRV